MPQLMSQGWRTGAPISNADTSSSRHLPHGTAGPDELHLLGFERRRVARVGQTQGTKLASESPDSPDENRRQALARGLIGCAALWGLIGVAFVFIGLALLRTVGWPCLFAYACVLVCVVMNRWRIRQSKLVRVASL
jgi:hypothetical protein